MAINFNYTPPGSAKAAPIDLLGYSDVDLIAREIRERSLFYEIDLLEHIYLSVPRRGVYLDVGANIGNHSVYFAKFCADHLVAIEPHPKLLPILRRNLEINVPERYNVVPIAVGASSGVGRINLRPNFKYNIGGSQVQFVSPSAIDCIDTVQVSTLDAVLGQFAPLLSTLPLALVKIDIEGMEYEALKGAHNLLTRYHPHLVIELADESARMEVRSFLHDYGYLDTGCRFGWTPTYHFVNPAFHRLPSYDQPIHSDLEVELLRQVEDEILGLVPEGHSYILVDEDRWWAGLAIDGRHRIPFLERAGVYWGRPKNDRIAVSELLRLKRSGARFILFAEPAFWWLGYYRGLANHLNKQAKEVLTTPRLRGYEL